MNSAFDQPEVEEFVDILENLNISYAIGGSIASSFYGQVRFTQDADISAESFSDKIAVFCEALQSSFYVSEQAVRQAHQHRTSFNAIHFDSAFKIDVFIVSNDPFKRQVLWRRKQVIFPEKPDRSYAFVSPEDIVLLKLQWYKDGGAISEKQWNDILGVIKNQQDELDREYLREWALKLSVSEFLEKAIQQAKE